MDHESIQVGWSILPWCFRSRSRGWVCSAGAGVALVAACMVVGLAAGHRDSYSFPRIVPSSLRAWASKTVGSYGNAEAGLLEDRTWDEGWPGRPCEFFHVRGHDFFTCTLFFLLLCPLFSWCVCHNFVLGGRLYCSPD